MGKWQPQFYILIFSSFILCVSTGLDKIYYDIKGFSPCFRRLNGTHQFGCSSLRSGNVGVLHIIKNNDDVDWILSDEAKSEPYIVLVKHEHFQIDILRQLKASKKVNGVILALNHSEGLPPSFSTDRKCPNEYSGLGPSHCDTRRPWNPSGSGIFFEDWPFPIFFLDKLESLNKIYECYETHNIHVEGDQQLCAVELLAYMLAVGDSKTCIRRSNLVLNLNPVKVCDPMGDQNFWLSPFPIFKNESKKTIVLISRLDSLSLFDTLVVGGDSPVTSIVTLIATAYQLKRLVKNQTELNTNLMYIFLHGESFDYIGSSRLIWDMEKGLLPITLEDIKLIIELNQLSNLDLSRLHIHLGQNRKGFDFANNLVKNSNISIKIEKTQTLPPASVQAFQKANEKIPGLVITDHGPEYVNKYYHSIFDNNTNINYNTSEESKSIQEFIAKISTSLAYTIFSEISQVKPDLDDNQIEEELVSLVDNLLHCYLISINCTLFKEALSPDQNLPSEPANTYVGVTVNNTKMMYLTAQTLAYLTGNIKDDWNQSQCTAASNKDPVFAYLWVNGKNMSGVCVQTLMNISAASSPAFEISDYDWSSGKYPTWTESTWADFRMRIFVKPPRMHEISTLIIGITVMVLSFIVVYFLNSRSEILFMSETPTVAC